MYASIAEACEILNLISMYLGLMSKPISEHDMAFRLPIDAYHFTGVVRACRASDTASAYHLVVFFAPPAHEVLVGV